MTAGAEAMMKDAPTVAEALRAQIYAVHKQMADQIVARYSAELWPKESDCIRPILTERRAIEIDRQMKEEVLILTGHFASLLCLLPPEPMCVKDGELDFLRQGKD